jgi:Protein of unknown function (DUF3305)
MGGDARHTGRTGRVATTRLGRPGAASLAVDPLPSMTSPPTLRVAVLMERLKQPSQWEDWRFRLHDVLIDDGRFGTLPRTLRDDGSTAQFLHPGFDVSLHRDEGEGYYLNLSSGAPAWFVMWRIDEADPSIAVPQLVTLSYHEAGRLLDAQERVDNVPLPADVVGWLQAYADEHYRPEPKQRRRPASW